MAVKTEDQKGATIYCPHCGEHCGEMSYGVLYRFGIANLMDKCPHCKKDISGIVKANQNF